MHYKTEWVDLPDVESVRKKLGAPANRTHRDGTPFYTLPIIEDPATGEIVGDSFEIAVYLDKHYRDAPSLFPPSTISLQYAFNVQVDAIFSQCGFLFIHGLPFHPETADVSRAEFVRRAGKEKWEDLNLQGKEREDKLEELKAGLEQLAKPYKLRDGPFLEGAIPIYADFIVGGWLQCFKVALKEWEEVKMWHDGLWGKILIGLEEYTEMR